MLENETRKTTLEKRNPRDENPKNESPKMKLEKQNKIKNRYAKFEKGNS